MVRISNYLTNNFLFIFQGFGGLNCKKCVLKPRRCYLLQLCKANLLLHSHTTVRPQSEIKFTECVKITTFLISGCGHEANLLLMMTQFQNARALKYLFHNFGIESSFMELDRM